MAKINCNESVGLQNKIGTCWNITVQTNMFYGHSSEIVQKKLSENTVEEILNPTVIENLERFLPPYLLDKDRKLRSETLDILKKIVINLQERFLIKMKQKATKQKNAEEDRCERDFVFYLMELLHPGKKNKEERDVWGGYTYDSFFLTNILDIILLNKLTHTINYKISDLYRKYTISLNIDKIKTIEILVFQSENGILDIKDLTLTNNNHICQFFECGGITKYSNNDTIIEYDWRMFFKVLNMLSVNDYNREANNSEFKTFSDYDTTPNPLPNYRIWGNSIIGPYIVEYDSALNPSSLYSFSPYFKKEKITNPSSIIATSKITQFNFSYNINCTPENIKQLATLNYQNYLELNELQHNIVEINKYLDSIDINNIIFEDNCSIITKIIWNLKRYTSPPNYLFIREALKRINTKTLNKQTKNIGWTALMYAIQLKNKKIIREILKYKPDLTLKNKNDQDVFFIAKVYDVDLNDINTDEYRNLKTAIDENNLSQVESLLDELIDIDETDINGWTILMFAAKAGNIEIVKAILKKNPNLSLSGLNLLNIADPNIRTDLIREIMKQPENVKPLKVEPIKLRPVSTFHKAKPAINKPVVNPLNVKPVVKPVNVKPAVNVKPKARHQKCDIVDTLTIPKLNEVFKEINQAAPPAKILKAQRLQILKELLNC